MSGCGNSSIIPGRPIPSRSAQSEDGNELSHPQIDGEDVCPGCGHDEHTGWCDCGCLDDRVKSPAVSAWKARDRDNG